jgi:hypothetical protein
LGANIVTFRGNIMSAKLNKNSLRGMDGQEFTICYCEQCRRPMATFHLVDGKSGWCPICRSVETISAFQTKPWLVGVAAVVAAQFSLIA